MDTSDIFSKKSYAFGNAFITVYINDYVKKFRNFNSDEFIVGISGLKSFIPKGDSIFDSLIEGLRQNNFVLEFEGDNENVNEIEITCKNSSKNTINSFKYQIQNIPNLIELSYKTQIGIAGIIIIRIVAQIISKLKVLYKAIILDLDDTLWLGTLSEDGIEAITENMKSEKGAPFLDFMNFIKLLCSELGIYIAICSRNETKLIESTINTLDENLFPLKNQIDCIIANNNNKSENIRIIAEQLSILPNSIIFIDDNQIVRDDVKTKLPDLFVPEWASHIDLVNILIASCVFERNELSLNSKNRRKQYKVLQSERTQNSLPELSIKIIQDQVHSESTKLFAKSNQFKFSSNNDEFSDDAISLYFEIIRENGENLGICSAITYNQTVETFHIYNWALSCRYFEMGLEEYILLYVYNMAKPKKLLIEYQETEYNQKVRDLIKQYSEIFKFNRENNQIEINLTNESVDKLKQNTNLRSL